jgi:hypothetical protein
MNITCIIVEKHFISITPVQSRGESLVRYKKEIKNDIKFEAKSPIC